MHAGLCTSDDYDAMLYDLELQPFDQIIVILCPF